MIFSHSDWIKEYKKDKYKIWIRAKLSNDKEVYLSEYKEWFKLKEYCQNQKADVKTLGLQYRSNYVEVDTHECDGVYLIRSMICLMGGGSRKTYTIGKIHGEEVHKTTFLIPELIEDRKEIDPLKDCFKEGLLYHDGTEPT